MPGLRVAVVGVLAACLIGCGGSGSGTASSVPAGVSSSAASAPPAAGTADTSSTTASSTGNTPAPTANAQVSVPLVLSSDASRNWANAAIRILNVSLTPQSGGTPVTIYTAPAATPVIN